jgi:predicted ATPase
MRGMGELEAYIPYIRYLLSVDPGDPAVAAMEAAVRRKKLFDALRALALRGARLRPLVLVVEDLHWIDTTAEEFLGFLIDSMAAVPLMLIPARRAGHRALAALQVAGDRKSPQTWRPPGLPG